MAVLMLVGCSHTRAVPTPGQEKAPPHEEDPFALCKELYPCPPTRGDDPPYMCAVSGSRSAPPEHVPGLTLERLVCPFRRAGAEGFVGVPTDGSRPLLSGDALLSRLHDQPRGRALYFGWPGESACKLEAKGRELRFCAPSLEPSQTYRPCALTSDNSISCATRDPERMIPLCQKVLGATRVSAIDRYWGPAANVVPSDHLKDGQSQWKDAAARRLPLRAGGREVRVLSCRTLAGSAPDELLVMMDPPEVISALQLLPKLDTVVMRAALAARVAVTGDTFLLLDPIGGPGAFWPAHGPCALPRGPRQSGKSLSFYMAPPIKNPLSYCEVDTSTWTGSCSLVAPGTFCE